MRRLPHCPAVFHVEQLHYFIKPKVDTFQPEYVGKLKFCMALSTCTYENLQAGEECALPATDDLTAAFDQISSSNEQ